MQSEDPHSGPADWSEGLERDQGRRSPRDRGLESPGHELGRGGLPLVLRGDEQARARVLAARDGDFPEPPRRMVSEVLLPSCLHDVFVFCDYKLSINFSVIY